MTLVFVTCQTFWRSLVWPSSSRLREIITFSTRFCPTRSLNSWVSMAVVPLLSVVFCQHTKQTLNKTCRSLSFACSCVSICLTLSLTVCVLQRCCWSQIIPMTTPSSLRGKPKWPPLMMQMNWWQQMSGSHHSSFFYNFTSNSNHNDWMSWIEFRLEVALCYNNAELKEFDDTETGFYNFVNLSRHILFYLLS